MGRVGLLGMAFLIAPSVEAATLVIRAEGVPSGQNRVYAEICDASFEEATCPYSDRAVARTGMAEMRIRNVKPESYAVAVFYDSNGNGRLDRNFIGLRREPYGFSNDVGRRGPPNVEAARIVVREPTTTIIILIR